MLKVVISELFLKYVTSIHLYSPELLIYPLKADSESLNSLTNRRYKLRYQRQL